MKKKVYSVGQVNAYIKNMFAQDFMLQHICVKGEVSNCKYHSSGHIYFTLKDAGGTMNAIMFAGYRRGLSFPMKEGDKVIVTGSIEIFERDGKYQLYAREIELDGAGNLYLQFEALKRELEEMGMFASEYKKPIPRYARKVGIVTAPTGAAIRDIQTISQRRNPYVQLILCPALVQGEGAAQSIAKGIALLDTMQLDVIIVGRGGGSIEDLWAFNEEVVARAIFDCQTPIISAVGHETDTTIADFVADLRAPTPSAAAELAVFDIRILKEQLAGLKKQLDGNFEQKRKYTELHLKQIESKLYASSPESKLREKRMLLLQFEQKLEKQMQKKFDQRKHMVAILSERMERVSPLRKLSGGYAFVTDEKQKALCDIAQVKTGDEIGVQLLNGKLKAKVMEVVS